MLAVIKLGGNQHIVKKGDTIKVDKLNHNLDEEVVINDVLSKITEGKIEIGTPFVKGASVVAKVVAQEKDKKVIIFKKIRRHNHRRKNGFRAHITKLEIVDIK